MPFTVSTEPRPPKRTQPGRTRKSGAPQAPDKPPSSVSGAVKSVAYAALCVGVGVLVGAALSSMREGAGEAAGTIKVSETQLLRASPPAPCPSVPVIAAQGSTGAVAQVPLSVAAFRSPSHWHRANPYLRHWTDADFLAAAESLITYRGALVHLTHDKYYRAQGEARFEAMPQNVSCTPLQRFGGVDGGKWVCGIEELKPGCIIYSVGSHGDFSFELEMQKNTPCQIFTFDCFSGNDETQVGERIKYFPLCMGEGTGDRAERFRSLRQIMEQLGHSNVALFKIDIEGFEYSVMESLVNVALAADGGGAALLPDQMLMELHYVTDAPTPWQLKAGLPVVGESSLSAGEISILWTQLSDLGYIPVWRELNPSCPSCSEFVILRAFV